MNEAAADPARLMELMAEKEETEAALLEKMDEWEEVSTQLEEAEA